MTEIASSAQSALGGATLRRVGKTCLTSGFGDALIGIGEGFALSLRPQYSVLPLDRHNYYYFQRPYSITTGVGGCIRLLSG